MAERLASAFVMPSNFTIHEVPTVPPGAAIAAAVPRLAPPTLGALAGFTGTFTGNGFNTIFRPQNSTTPTPLPVPVPGSDNVLELNLTSETLSFQPGLGSIPNRGTLQGDIFLNGVPYVQSINDVTNPGQSTGIHFEPGIWLIVPKTTAPDEAVSVARMASIPHGTTIVAQGIAVASAGPPNIAPVDITPTVIKTGAKVPFPSQTASNQETARIPQDLTPFMLHGTITQALLDDPNSLLRAQITGQTILATTTLIVKTDPTTPPTAPLFGGGTDNIAFLLGDPAAANPNAQAVTMSAIFWIETVQYTLQIPIFAPGQGPIIVEPDGPRPFGRPVPRFNVDPPVPVPAPRTLTVTSIQIQYTQTVNLNFKNLSWPHVSVATLVPADPVNIPDSAWS